MDNYDEMMMRLLKANDRLQFIVGKDWEQAYRAFMLGAAIVLDTSPHQLEIELESLAERTVL